MVPERVFLLPGEYIVSKKPHRVTTLLGSCVAVCLYSRRAGFGGINHYMLPTSSGERTAKYGDYSLETMLRLMKHGAGSLDGVEAMVFGGGNVVGAIRSGAWIGEKNVEVAHSILRKHNIRITREHVRGETGLKLTYQTWDNQVEYRWIERSVFAQSMLAKQERFDKSKIRVLVVDDSALVRSLLVKAMADAPDLEVVGEAKDAYEARELLLERNPDVITLDIIMPRMDGVSFLKRLMVFHPKPVVIISTIAKSGSRAEFRADKIGAVEVIDKESLEIYRGLDKVKSVLLPKIRTAARAFVQKKTKEEVAGI